MMRPNLSLATMDAEPAVPILPAHRAHRTHWLAAAARGVTALVVGLCTLALPELSVAALLAMLAGYTLVSAAASLSVAREVDRRHEAAWPFLAYGAMAAVIAGLLLWWPLATLAPLRAVLTVWLSIAGVAELMLALELRRRMPHAWLLGGVGATSVGAAVTLLLQPRWVADTEARILGVYSLLSGLFLVGFAARLHRAQRALHTHRP